MTLPAFLGRIVTARFDFDRLADRWARADRRTGSDLVTAFRATAAKRFAVPGAPAAAPLSHLVIHSGDVVRPLGVLHQVDPRAATIVLRELTSPRGLRSLRPGLLDGLTITTTDTSWAYGDDDGERGTVSGPADAVIAAIAGRPAALRDLTGDGVPTLHARLTG